MKLVTNSPLDKLIGGIECDAITNVYGPAGSGKTNIVICALIGVANDKKVIYIDTEGSFSLERFEQLGGSEKQLKNIIFIEPHEWKEQHSSVQDIEKITQKEDVGLIVIDSFVALYRLELDEKNFQLINRQLATQYSILSKITRKYKIPVLITNQVYGYRSGEEDKTELTSRTIAKYWSKALIELKKLDKSNHRIAIVRKHRSMPEGKSIEFEITENKLKEVGKFSFI
ncbi:MAG: DNA repair and recombination protein RadB [Candidatus Aenigmatarchaeota archaeon]